MMEVKKILIIPNPKRDEGLCCLREVIEIAAKKAKLYIDEEYAQYNNILCAEFVKKEKIYSAVDAVLVLGGDGTLLSAANEASNFGVPVLGINLGHLGFLAEVERSKIAECLEKLFTGDYVIEERMMLKAVVTKNGNECFSFNALNDVVVTKTTGYTLMDIDVFINDEFMDDFKSDGVIISTPTGSTAYSLSAGGPIISPDVAAFAVTPICPHKLYSRAVVVSCDKKIYVKIRKKKDFSASVLIDGRDVSHIKCGDMLEVSKSDKVTKLIRLNGNCFYSILRQKLTGKEL